MDMLKYALQQVQIQQLRILDHPYSGSHAGKFKH